VENIVGGLLGGGKIKMEGQGSALKASMGKANLGKGPRRSCKSRMTKVSTERECGATSTGGKF